MKQGVFYAGMAGAIWGAVILAPSLLPEFSPLLISCVRFALYGALSLLIALPFARRLFSRLGSGDLGLLVRLSLAGNLLYFALLSTAVQLAGVTIASLINGILPIAITCLGRGHSDSLSMAQLKWPLLMVMAGILCINLDPAALSGVDSSEGERLLGIACAFAGVACWAWFATRNAQYLKSSSFSSGEWATLSGVVTGALALVFGGLGWLLLPQAVPANLPAERWLEFFWVCLFLAVCGSWLAIGFWNAATRRLPMSLGGQLIVFETLFACAYAFVIMQRLPGPLETLAIVLLTGGVAWAVSRHRRPVASAPAEGSLPG